MTRRLTALLFDGVDLLDVCDPYEVLLAARNGDPAPFEVTTITVDDASADAYEVSDSSRMATSIPLIPMSWRCPGWCRWLP